MTDFDATFKTIRERVARSAIRQENDARPVDQWLLQQWPDLALARAAGDIEKCVRLRRADPGITDLDGAEREERAWHLFNSTQETTPMSTFATDAVDGAAAKRGDTNPKAARAAADGKLRLELLDTAMTHGVAEVLAHGADKYGVHNWRTVPINASTYVGALRRHVDEWSDGADADHDSGKHPLHHIAATCNVVLDAIKHGTLVDDRNFAEAKPPVELTDDVLDKFGADDVEPVGAGVSRPTPICGANGRMCPIMPPCRNPCPECY